jgi:hypothetical protein
LVTPKGVGVVVVACTVQALKSSRVGSENVSVTPGPPLEPGTGVAGVTLTPRRRLTLDVELLVMLYVHVEPFENSRFRWAIWFEA